MSKIIGTSALQEDEYLRDIEQSYVMIRMEALSKAAKEILNARGVKIGSEAYKDIYRAAKRNRDFMTTVMLRATSAESLEEAFKDRFTKTTFVERKDMQLVLNDFGLMCAVSVHALVGETKYFLESLRPQGMGKYARELHAVKFSDLKHYATMVLFTEILFSGAWIVGPPLANLGKYKPPKDFEKTHRQRIADKVVEVANDLLRERRQEFTIRSKGPRNGQIERNKLANAVALKFMELGIKRPTAETIYKVYLPKLMREGRIK